jgi:hypothetical protein
MNKLLALCGPHFAFIFTSEGFQRPFWNKAAYKSVTEKLKIMPRTYSESQQA